MNLFIRRTLGSSYYPGFGCTRSYTISYLLFFADQGTSKIEKGQTPRQNMTLSFYTWSEFEKNCGYSRLYGGVNFPDSVANIRDLAIRMGRRAVDFVRYHVNLARNPQENSSSGEKEEEEDENSWKYYLRDRSHHQRKKNGGISKPKSLNYKYFVINP